MLLDELICSYESASGKIFAEGVCDNRSINYCDKSVNTNETPLEQNQFTESNLANDYIDVDTILKEINDSLTRNDDVLETVNENADTNFNDMLHNNVQCVTANYANSGLYDAVEYLMDDVIKEFIDKCFAKNIIFGENSVYDNFYNEVSANNHDTLASNNSNDACISKNVNDVESTIRHDEITIYPNSNFDKITDANIPAIIEESEINSISKVTILNDLIKECPFLEEYRNLIATSRKENTNQIS